MPLQQEIHLSRKRKKATNAGAQALDDMESVRATTAGIRRLLSLEVDSAAAAEAAAGGPSAAEVALARRVNQEFIEGFDWALVKMNGWGLGDFRPRKRKYSLEAGETRCLEEEPCAWWNLEEPPRKRAMTQDAEGTRARAALEEILDGNQLYRPTCHLHCDMGSHSWYGAVYLVMKPIIRGTLSFDILHRWTNDQAFGVSEAGLTVMRLEVLGAMNIRRGPFNKNGNHASMLTAAKDLFASQTSYGPLFSYYYEELCRDWGEEGPRVGTAAHMQEMWLQAQDRLTNATLGKPAKRSRWFSWEQMFAFQRENRVLTKMLLIFIGFRRGWWKTFDGSPLVHELDAPLAAVEGENNEGLEGAKEGGPDPGEAAGQQAEDMDAPQKARMSLKESRGEVQRRRDACVAGMKLTCTVLHRPFTSAMCDGMCYVTRPLMEFFQMSETRLHTRDGCRFFLEDMATGAGDGIVHKIMNAFQDAELTRLLGMHNKLKGPAAIARECRVAATLWKYTLHMVSALCVTHLKFAEPHRLFAALLSAAPGARDAALQRLKKLHDCLDKMDTAAASDSQADAFLNTMEWPRAVWNRENLLYLSEAEFETVPKFLEKHILYYALSHGTTLAVENMGNATQRVMKKNDRHRMEPKYIWQTCAMGSTVMQDFEIPTLPTTAAAEQTSAKKLPRDMFDGRNKQGSLTATELEGITMKKPDWPSHNAATHKETGILTMAMLDCGGDWDRLATAWFSLLLVPGSIVRHDVSAEVLLVLHTTPYGFIGLRVTPLRRGTSPKVAFTVPADRLVAFRIVHDPAEWQAMDVRVTIPHDPARAQAVRDRPGFLAIPTEASPSVYMHSVKYGLPNFTVPFLRKLFDHLKCPYTRGQKPTTEAAIVLAIVKKVYGADYTDEIGLEVLKTKTESLIPHEAAEAPLLTDDLMELLGGEFENVEFEREIQEYNSAMKLDMARREKRAREAARFMQEAEDADDGAQAAPAAAVRPQLPKPENAFTQKETKFFLPAGYGVSKETKRDARWRIKSPYGVKEFNKCFNRFDADADYSTLRQLLRQAWLEYERHTDRRCPWDLGDSID